MNKTMNYYSKQETSYLSLLPPEIAFLVDKFVDYPLIERVIGFFPFGDKRFFKEITDKAVLAGKCIKQAIKPDNKTFVNEINLYVLNSGQKFTDLLEIVHRKTVEKKLKCSYNIVFNDFKPCLICYIWLEIVININLVVDTTPQDLLERLGQEYAIYRGELYKNYKLTQDNLDNN